jgi:formylglycine-generating enzyme required for sulfatase activity
MARVPAGTFTMGKDGDGKGDRPAHRVTLTHAFYIDRTEATASDYAACVAAGACSPRFVRRKQGHSVFGCNLEPDRGRHPANCIDRSQAEAYCAFVRKRLPTEAEWEYAARGTDGRDYPWGNDLPTACTVAVVSGTAGCGGPSRGTSEVGLAERGKSPFGAVDMAGNVWEWVADDYAPYPEGAVTDPLVKGSPGPKGVVRGGSWDYGTSAAKTSYRLPFTPELGSASLGVRCARNE